MLLTAFFVTSIKSVIKIIEKTTLALQSIQNIKYKKTYNKKNSLILAHLELG